MGYTIRFIDGSSQLSKIIKEYQSFSTNMKHDHNKALFQG